MGVWHGRLARVRTMGKMPMPHMKVGAMRARCHLCCHSERSEESPHIGLEFKYSDPSPALRDQDDVLRVLDQESAYIANGATYARPANNRDVRASRGFIGAPLTPVEEACRIEIPMETPLLDTGSGGCFGTGAKPGN